MSNRATYQQYLLSKGLSPTQVGGILLNIEDESGFNPNPSGSNDNGMSYGLFQHYGPRRDALFNYAGTSSPSWKQQIDYALTEPDMAAYLAQDYPSYGHAGVSFLRKFERPAEKHAKARAAKYMANHSNDVAPDGHTVPASAITGDPSAYSGGSIMPVSAIPQGTLMPDTQQQAQQPQGLLGNLDPALGGLIGLSMLAGSFGGQQGGMGGTLAALMPLLMPQQGNAPAAPKMGTTTIKRGDEEVTFLTKDGVPVQEIGTAPRWQPGQAGDDRTAVMQNLEAAGLSPGSDEYRSAMLDYVTKPGVNITQVPKAPSGYTYKDPTNPGLGLKAIPGGPATQPTGEERSAAAYAERMQAAERQLSSVEDAPQMQGSKEAGVDAALAAGGRFTNWLRSPAGQQHQNAADQWIRAKLRKESGATIAQEEWDSEYKTYFPQPGDSEEVKKQKAEARAVATQTMMTQAGRAQPDLTPTDDDMQEILDLIP